MENTSYSYKNVSHFSNYLLKINNKPNKIIYSDKIDTDASTLLLTETASSRMFLEVEKHIKGDLPKTYYDIKQEKKCKTSIKVKKIEIYFN